MVQLTYPTRGRGAWPENGAGGTLNSDGTAAGAYYRAPAAGTPMAMPGYVAYKLLAAGAPLDINYYAVHLGVRAIQREIGATVDGLFGPATGARLATWQTEKRLPSDGVFGEVTAKAMFGPIANAVAKATSNTSQLPGMVTGHVTVESGWDPGAVGRTTPHDLGLGQINGDAHPDLTVDFRLSPRLSLAAVATFVLDDLASLNWITRDAIAAYNLGIGGARSWIKAGRPDVYKGAPIGSYVAAVLDAMS